MCRKVFVEVVQSNKHNIKKVISLSYGKTTQVTIRAKLISKLGSLLIHNQLCDHHSKGLLSFNSYSFVFIYGLDRIFFFLNLLQECDLSLDWMRRHRILKGKETAHEALGYQMTFRVIKLMNTTIPK